MKRGYIIFEIIHDTDRKIFLTVSMELI